MPLLLLLFLAFGNLQASPIQSDAEKDGDASRKILGSSVVTSVSVIMDSGHGSQTYFADAAGKPVSKPQTSAQLASPINLLNPDRYEFFTFDDNGELIKRLMTLEEIQGIIANGDGEEAANSETYLPEKKVNDIVSNVQNVLKEEIKSHKNNTPVRPVLDTPDVSSTWSMILPAIFGNSGEDITPDKTQTIATPDTIMVENVKPTVDIFDATKFETHVEEIKPVHINIPETETKKPTELDTPLITVEIVTNKPEIEATKDIERIPLNSTKPTSATTQAPATSEASKNVEVVTSKKQPIITTEKITLSTNEKNVQEQTTQVASDIVNTKISDLDDIIKAETSISPSISIETTPQLLLLETTPKPSPSTTTETKPMTPNSKPTTLLNLSTTRPVLFIGNEEVTQAEKITPSSSTGATSLSEENNESLSQIQSDIHNKSSLSTSTQSTLLSTTTVTSTSVSPIPSIETTPILLIIQQKVKETTTPETSTSGFLSTFFFIDDRNKNKHQTTPLPTSSFEETSASSSSNQVLAVTEEGSTANIETLLKPTNSHEEATTVRVKIERTTQNVPKETSKSPLVTIDPLKLEEQTKQATTNVQVSFVNNEIVTQKSPNVIDTTTLFDGIQEDTTTKGTSVYDDDLKPIVDNDVTAPAKELTTQNPMANSKSPVTETLGQFLLSSTNIYEINSQLTDSSSSTVIPQDVTTEQTIISSIEQLISQAVGIDENPVLDTDSTKKVEQVLDNTKDKLMDEAQAEIATVASVLLDKDTNDSSLDDDNLQLSEAVGSLLSQVSEMLPTVNDTMESLLQMDVSEIPVSNTTIEESLILPSTSTEKTLPVLINTEYSINKSNDTSEAPEMIYEEIDIQKIMDEINLTQQLNKTKEQNTATKINGTGITNVNINENLHVQLIQDPNKKETHNITSEVEQTTNIEINEGSHNVYLTEDSNKKEKQNISATTNTTNEEKDNIHLTQDANENETQSSTVKIDAMESINLKPNEVSHINVVSQSNWTKIAENATKKPQYEIITTTTSKPKNKFKEAIKLQSNLTNEGIKTTDISKTPTKIEMQLQNNVKPQITTTEKVVNVYDVITSTVKYSSSSLLTPSANNVVKVVINNSPSNYKMETATETFNTSTTKRKVSSEQQDQKNSTWTLVPTVLPHSNVTFAPVAPKPTMENLQPPTPVKLSPHPVQGFGLEDSTSRLDTDIYQFVELCNELAFGFWSAVTTGISSVRSIFVSPFAATSLLAMVFLGARGATSGEMNEILKLDDMVTFNPHLIFKNVSESIEVSKNAGVAASVIARELYSDRNKGKLLNFYKERAKQFYDGHVEEVNFKEIGDVIRRRTNLLVKKYTWGKIQEYMKDGTITVRPPLAGVSASVFQTDCSGASTNGRDGELYFVVLPSVRQRRLIPVPSVVFRNGFLAGYDPGLDATAAAIGTQDQTVSVIFVIPGQQGVSAPGDGLWRLEKRLGDSSFKQGSWSRLLRSLIPRPGLELQIPRFSHKSVINATVALKNMGLKDLFSYDKADLKGLNGASHELHLSDILQINNFVMCGEVPIGDNHHVEIYPATAKRPSRRSRKLELRLFNDPYLGEEPRDYQRAFNDPLHDPDLLTLPLSMRPRQARIPDSPRLRFDRPFLFFVRHNPTGLILHMGRFNPRLLP